MRPEEIKQEIQRLNLSEKLLLVEDIWDSIAQSNSDLPMPEWQKAELDKRYKEFKAGKQNLHNWQSFNEGLRKKIIKDELLSEYDFDYSKVVRGKYYKKLMEEGSNIIVLEPDVADAFHDSESVNKALRSLLEIA